MEIDLALATLEQIADELKRRPLRFFLVAIEHNYTAETLDRSDDEMAWEYGPELADAKDLLRLGVRLMRREK